MQKYHYFWCGCSCCALGSLQMGVFAVFLLYDCLVTGEHLGLWHCRQVLGVLLLVARTVHVD